MITGTIISFLKNVKASPKTTIVGGILICLSIYLLLTSTETITYILDSSLLAVGIILLFLKDWNPENEKKDESN